MTTQAALQLITVASAEALAPITFDISIKEVHKNWKNDKTGYYYRGELVVKLAYNGTSKYQLTLHSNTKIIIDASAVLSKIAPKLEPATPAAPKIEDKVTVTYITAPAPVIKQETAIAPIQETIVTPAAAPKLTIDIVKELALQLSLADQATLASQINSAMAAKLSENTTPAPIQETIVTPAPAIVEAPAAPKQEDKPAEAPAVPRLCKEYPVHHDRLVTWTEEKYPGVEIPDILKNWGNGEINGVKKVSDKAIGEKYSVGPATVTEELSTIAFLMALKHGVVIEYLTKIGVTISSRVSKLSSKDQTITYNAIIKKWENKQVTFNNLNCAVKWHLKTNLDHVVMVMVGKEKLQPKQK
jgi:hypothetical protein